MKDRILPYGGHGPCYRTSPYRCCTARPKHALVSSRARCQSLRGGPWPGRSCSLARRGSLGPARRASQLRPARPRGPARRGEPLHGSLGGRALASRPQDSCIIDDDSRLACSAPRLLNAFRNHYTFIRRISRYLRLQFRREIPNVK